MGIRRNQSVCYGKVCEAEVCGTDVCEDFIPFMCGNRMRATLISPTCKGVTFVGTEDVSIRQGIGINLLDGVYAYDEDGTELPVTVSPETISKCEVGNHEVVYTAIGAYLSRDKRNVTITQIDPPTISGMDTAHISVDTDFDPANGVSAVDDNGNTVPFEYSGEYYRDASGAIASFETLKQTSAVSVLTTIEPIQSGSGTPSPDNVRPISGHTECVTSVTGKNLLDSASLQWVRNKARNASGDEVASTASSYTSTMQKVVPNTQFTLGSNTTYSGLGARVYYLDKNGQWIGGTDAIVVGQLPYTFTTPQDCYYIQFQFNTTAIDTSGFLLWLKVGSDGTYEPYNGNTYTTSLGRPVYGGSLDVVSGVLTVTHGILDLGTLTYSKSSVVPNGFVATAGMPDDFPIAPSSSYVPDWICSQYKVVSNVGIERADFTIAFRVSASNKGVIVRDSNYASYYTDDDMASFKTVMDGVQLVYDLSTPQTYQLTPTEVELLLGTNNLWTDCGETSVTWEDNIPTSGAYQYPIKGTYQITYTAEDECGNETEVTKTIVAGD